MKHIGMIGFGAIARQVHTRLAAGGQYRFTLLRGADRRKNVPIPAGIAVAERLDDFISARPELVLEMAGQSVVETILPTVVDAAIPVILCSTGALADDDLFMKLTEKARHAGTRFIVASGAIGGLDYLKAIASLPDAAVTYVSRKPLAAWPQELAARGLIGEDLRGAVTLFEGTAAAAARLFPRNLNAALALSLAIRETPLTVRVLADPVAHGNTHEIEATSAAGSAFFRFVNVPSPDNPKTSLLTALSVVSTVEDHFDNHAASRVKND